MPGGEDDKGFGHGEAQRVGTRHDRRFGHGRVLDDHAFEFERADAIVGGLEHVIGAANVGDVAVLVDAGNVAGTVVAVAHDFSGLFGVAGVADHEADRALVVHADRHFAFARRMSLGIEHGDRVTR